MKARLIIRMAGLAAVASLSTALAVAAESRQASTQPQMTVFKDPNCGCCKLWVEYVRKHAFTVTTKDTSDLTAIKNSARVPAGQRSCHTAFVNGYVIEGHVPVEDIKRLLAEKPKVAGISAPGMPMGSPGMEGPYPADRYEVVSFAADGKTRVFATH